MANPSILGSAVSAGTDNVSHTLSAGSNRGVFVYATRDGSTSIGSCSYGGVRMWRVAYGEDPSTVGAWYYLPEWLLPADGANSASCGNADNIHCVAVQDMRLGATFVSARSGSGANPVTASITTVTDNSLILSGACNNADTSSYSSHGTGQTELTDVNGNGATSCTTWELKATAGADTQSHTIAASSGRHTMACIAIEPYNTDDAHPIGDTAYQTDASDQTPDVSHTLVSGGNRMVFVTVAWQDGSALTCSCTYGGQAMTALTRYNEGANYVQSFYLLSADLPANGVNTMTATFSGIPDYSMIVVNCYKNIKQGAPDDDTGRNEGAADETETVSLTAAGTSNIAIGSWSQNGVMTNPCVYNAGIDGGGSVYSCHAGFVSSAGSDEGAQGFRITGVGAITVGFAPNAGAGGQRMAMDYAVWEIDVFVNPPSMIWWL